MPIRTDGRINHIWTSKFLSQKRIHPGLTPKEFNQLLASQGIR
ncbi:hypothetical protein [Leptospira levettii]|nr:hypothetical protein [Leptospira levettii]